MSEGGQKKLLRLSEVLQRVPVSKSTWYALVRSGKAPQPVRLGERIAAWDEEEINALVERLLVER